MFESVSGGRETSTLTLFAIVMDKAMVHTCIEAAEAITGDLEATPTAMMAAWPLPIVKGFPKSNKEA
jgi:hypothetical protein